MFTKQTYFCVPKKTFWVDIVNRKKILTHTKKNKFFQNKKELKYGHFWDIKIFKYDLFCHFGFPIKNKIIFANPTCSCRTEQKFKVDSVNREVGKRSLFTPEKKPPSFNLKSYVCICMHVRTRTYVRTYVYA